MWANPTTQEADSDRELTETGRRKGVTGKDSRSLNLARQVKLWPTPRAANPGSRPNSKGGRVLEEEVQIAAGLRTRGQKLADHANDLPTSTSGQLNPAWVEWLMGYPNRTHRLRGLGNAIVPQVAEQILKAMIQSENNMQKINTEKNSGAAMPATQTENSMEKTNTEKNSGSGVSANQNQNTRPPKSRTQSLKNTGRRFWWMENALRSMTAPWLSSVRKSSRSNTIPVPRSTSVMTASAGCGSWWMRWLSSISTTSSWNWATPMAIKMR